MDYTSDLDKRDLLNIFGLDKRVQVKDNFFHNANSMIRRDVWGKISFDGKITNIEDRVWAKEVLKHGYKIIYEPEANVYHYHGIHQDNDVERCYNVVRILESLEELSNKNLKADIFDIQRLNVIALIPVRGKVDYLNGRPLIEYTITRCKQSKFIKDIIVSTDNSELAEISKNLGAKAPFLRGKELSYEYVDLEKVLRFSLDEMKKNNIIPDILVILEITYPFRPKNLLDSLITELVKEGLDSVIVGKPEYKSCWVGKGSEIKRVDEGFIPRSLKQPFYIGLMGLGCATYPATLLMEGSRLGGKVGIVEVLDICSSIEVRDKEGFDVASKIIDSWFKESSLKV